LTPFGSPGETYLAIALISLSATNKTLIFVNNEIKEDMNLEPGDAML